MNGAVAMRGPKKHPLEVFKASGRPLGETPVRPQEAERAVPRVRPEPPVAARSAAGEFELRLSLPGAAVLLFAWVVMMGAAYMMGYSRGTSAERAEQDAAARALGRRIETAAASEPVAPAVPSAVPRTYGVLLVTYNTDDRARIDEMSRILAEAYGITGLSTLAYADGKVEVMAGRFDDEKDPALAKLLAKLRRIDDWPVGGKRPFATAFIKKYPDTARRAD